MKTKTLFLSLAVAVIGLLGCYPGSVTVSELDTVLTIYEHEEDFSRFKTYHMPDTIVAIGDEDGESNGKYDRQMLDQIRTNLDALGYQSVDTINADIVILVEKSNSELLIGWDPCPGCWCGYWCWYPGWGWGGGYNPYYPSGGVVYSYPIGTLFISMFDNTGTEMPMTALAPWAASINGLISGSDSQILARIVDAIDQSFTQSPYLGTN